MKILLTGGGTGGHFYPIIAIVEQIHEIAKEQKILEPQIYYAGPVPYDDRILFDNNITFVKTSAGKIRRYFSILNFFDIFKTAWGIVESLIALFNIYPDVIFGKGGYASFPILFAARILRIPVIIHESDSRPGRVNLWAGKFARKIAISYKEAASFFPADKVAHTGNPIRKEIATPATHGAQEFFNLQSDIPTLLVLGGSQGSSIINETIIDALPTLLESYQIIHQTGEKNFVEIKNTAEVVTKDSKHPARYRPFGHLNALYMRMASGAANLVISRAGSTIFEIAQWELPSIIIPIPEKISHDQLKNSFNYARTGACVVIEEDNLTNHILVSEIHRLLANAQLLLKMKTAAKAFAHPDAAHTIAKAILDIALTHEK
ncbi:MAG: UDP-N-acetylglucosamine--N-acetylmuramyl-(pentapeptide) pyrophosphoryl-undecaprenol N-acetylglucosamine transferase [Candidatus Taylorbacteria bacterium]|nr:UDP-N-acetylglucosamine--N-acetylmuramyl-(pentapeptide) pyrophosphoryl-undecaprenol N-acetylglucosamine transferase [Candidatus Taylorbacteria bacterium]